MILRPLLQPHLILSSVRSQYAALREVARSLTRKAWSEFLQPLMLRPSFFSLMSAEALAKADVGESA
ncbi:hypothetical protein RN69_35905 [Bradyrhizobium japonicum]|nr:hypothetical protein RN69_35905 [Bradyrhizobium japonicum]KMJ93924.1 hypothetical protein CF64_40440 [Bradyrhizobium japonicum]